MQFEDDTIKINVYDNQINKLVILRLPVKDMIPLLISDTKQMLATSPCFSITDNSELKLSAFPPLRCAAIFLKTKAALLLLLSNASSCSSSSIVSIRSDTR